MSKRDDTGARANDLEVELFALARSDVPSAEARRRALVALGVGASVVTAVQAAAVVKAGAVAGASVATGQVAKAAVVITAIKWAVVGAVAGTVVLGGAVGVEKLTSSGFATSQTRSDNSRRSESAPRLATAPARELLPQPEPEVQPTSDRGAPAAAPAARMNANSAAAPTPEPPAQEIGAHAADSSTSLAEEVTRIDRARNALGRGSSNGALLELGEYDRRFPAGMMRPEATVVRIEAMVESGNLEGARVLGRRFLSVNPGGGLALRVHRVIGE